MKFQNPSIHHSKIEKKWLTDTHTHAHTDKPKAICASQIEQLATKIFFFEIVDVRRTMGPGDSLCMISLNETLAVVS